MSGAKRARPKSVEEIVRALRVHEDSRVLIGSVTKDKNFPGRLLLVRSTADTYSIASDDLLGQHKAKDGRDIVEVKPGAQVLHTEPESLGTETLAVHKMELIAPPPSPTLRKGDLKPATAEIQSELRGRVRVAKSIAGAAAEYNDSCAGGDDYPNDCAHFLSDAFIRAGYTELLPNNDCVEARCGTASKRPIRARNMWCWFKKMATKSQTTLPTNKGMWAVFQLKESEYWGGHVLIVDTDTGTTYGTGHYPQWDQYAYQW